MCAADSVDGSATDSTDDAGPRARERASKPRSARTESEPGSERPNSYARPDERGEPRVTAETTADRARSLRRTARAEPTAEVVAELAGLLEADDPATKRLALSGLRRSATRAPELLAAELADDLEGVRTLLTDPDDNVRAAAASFLGAFCRVDPDAVRPAVPSLATLLEDEYGVARRNALEALERLSAVAPEAVRPIVDSILGRLESDHDDVRARALTILARLSADDGAVAAPAVSTLRDLFRYGVERPDGSDGPDDADGPRDESGTSRRLESVHRERRSRHRRVRQLAGHTLRRTATADPDAVAPVADDVVALVADPDPHVRTAAAETLLALADGRPDAVEPHLETLAERFEDDAGAIVPARVAQTVAVLGPTAPEPVASIAVEHAPRIRSLLEADEPPVRGAAATLLALGADERPSIVEPAADRLQELRDGTDRVPEYVRAAADDALSTLETGR